MSDYIERVAAILEIQRHGVGAQDFENFTPEQAERFVIGRLESIPAADVALVVHAKWEWNEDGIDYGIGSWVCGNCKARPETVWQEDESIVPYWWSGGHFCSNCGARMEEDNG